MQASLPTTAMPSPRLLVFVPLCGANLEVLPIAGAWKLVALEVLTQERL